MMGIFDSGSGGLTVLRAIRDRLSSPDIIYFGDTLYAPYGSRTREELSVLTVKALQFLQGKGARSIVSACNSVSASLAISLYDALSLSHNQIIEMVGPTVAYFKNSNARILLCATPATIQSGIYQSGFQMIGKEVTAVPIPDLAGAIEFGKPTSETENIIRNAFVNVEFSQFDVLILACTHYPLAKEAFLRVIPNTVLIFDPAIAVAERVEKEFWPREAGNGTTSFFISKESDVFRTFVEQLFPKDEYAITVIERS